MPILWPLKVPERGNAITQRKTLEIEHSCLFIHHTIWIYPFPHLILKIPTQIKLPKPNFRTQKIPESKFQTQKNPLIIPVTWNPEYPPLGWRYIWYYTESTTEHSRPTPLQYGLFESKDLLPLGAGVLPYICLIGNECAAPMGMVFAPFWSENG